jgi:hypothetical protein
VRFECKYERKINKLFPFVNLQEPTTLQKLGWIPVTPKAKQVNKEICSFSIDIEKYVAMEALFNPKIMGSDVRSHFYVFETVSVQVFKKH